MTGTAAAVASGVDFGRYGGYTVKRAAARDGGFQRPVYPFTGRVTADGASGYRAEPGRYHLYVSLPHLNPSRIVPAGPLLDWGAPHHHRDRLAG